MEKDQKVLHMSFLLLSPSPHACSLFLSIAMLCEHATVLAFAFWAKACKVVVFASVCASKRGSRLSFFFRDGPVLMSPCEGRLVAFMYFYEKGSLLPCACVRCVLFFITYIHRRENTRRISNNVCLEMVLTSCEMK